MPDPQCLEKVLNDFLLRVRVMRGVLEGPRVGSRVPHSLVFDGMKGQVQGS